MRLMGMIWPGGVPANGFQGGCPHGERQDSDKIGLGGLSDRPVMALNCGFVEPMTGIEPAYSAWEADVLPLNYIGAVA